MKNSGIEGRAYSAWAQTVLSIRFPSSSLKNLYGICYCRSNTKTQIGASLDAEIEQPNLMRVKGFNLNVSAEEICLICSGGKRVGVIYWCLCLLAYGLWTLTSCKCMSAK